MEKKLYRDEHHKVLGGVCAGLAEYFDVDVSIIRVLFALSLVLKGVGFVPYIILWIVLPRKSYNFNDPGYKPGVTPGFNPNFSNPFSTPHVDYTVPPVMPGAPFVPAPKKASNAGIIFGVALIVLGAAFLLDEFDFIPEVDFERIWPVILVAVGITMIFTGQKKQPWEKQGWQAKAEEPAFNPNIPSDADTMDNTVKKEDDQNNYPPVV